jgi:hypothetical protein
MPPQGHPACRRLRTHVEAEHVVGGHAVLHSAQAAGVVATLRRRATRRTTGPAGTTGRARAGGGLAVGLSARLDTATWQSGHLDGRHPLEAEDDAVVTRSTRWSPRRPARDHCDPVLRAPARTAPGRVLGADPLPAGGGRPTGRSNQSWRYSRRSAARSRRPRRQLSDQLTEGGASSSSTQPIPDLTRNRLPRPTRSVEDRSHPVNLDVAAVSSRKPPRWVGRRPPAERGLDL